MIRKVYLDFIRRKVKGFEFRWLLSRGLQYLLIHASAVAGRPFCGPVLGTLVTNYRCNYRCAMCGLPHRDAMMRSRGLAELDTDGMLSVLREFRDLGVSGIGFTGGEPLLRADIIELLAYAKELGLITHLNTNGSLLDESTVGKILDAEVDSINISLDGARPEIHDRIRGVPGAFAKAVDAIKRTRMLRDRRAAKLRIKTVAVLQEENVDEVDGLIDLAQDLSVDCIEFIPLQAFVAGERTGAASTASFLEKADRATARLLAAEPTRTTIENSPAHLRLFPGTFRGEPSPVKCYAGYNSLAVDSYGDIYPCVPWYNWQMPVANIGEKGLAEFWNSSAYNRTRRDIARCRKCTLNCQTELNFLFCPGGKETS